MSQVEEDLEPLELVMKYALEIAFGVLFLITFINYWIGSGTNRQIAMKWHNLMLPLIQDNFVYVGLEDGIEQTQLE